MTVYIVAAKRSPIGSFQGSLSSLSSVELGTTLVKQFIHDLNLPSDFTIDECFWGSALQANLGQNVSRQIVINAGLNPGIISTTINKVCASSMKATICGIQSILLGDSEVVLVGGSESMSNVPYYVNGGNIRRGEVKYGNINLIDGLQFDGLTNVFEPELLMGHSAEKTAKEFSISRLDQDEYAINCYETAIQSYKDHKFDSEIIPIEIKTRKGSSIINKDEDLNKYNRDKLKTVKPAFIPDGTVTAANSPSFNDGAAVLLLVNEQALHKYGLTAIAKVRSYGEAERDPIDFTIAPSLAITKALNKINTTIDDIDYFEINEAFSVVGIANAKLLNIPHEKLNVYGGSVALGHPLGASGARILTTLVNILTHESTTSKLGVAGICNGGGGASAIVIEKV
ncbi:acetyl-CoA acetyltransferase ia [Scheffersomyces coipomensis]|uniref:acetyl-CoA acetyltransferase ia n=1 Tax=Scheffersomyces coipomensis TaxID=1788519 RepID=UPI00315C6D31